MRTSVKTFAIAIALFATAFTANADDKDGKKSTGFGTGFYTTTSGKLAVMVEKASNEKPTVLLLKNEKGQTIYQETVGRHLQKFGRQLNVDDLAAGVYEIEVRVDGQKQTKSFELTDAKTERTLAIK